MLSRQTTFVLGAGASHDFKLPTGEELQTQISKILQIDQSGRKFTNDRMWQAIQPCFSGHDWPTRAEAFAKAAAKITRGLPASASIDNFLHTHQDDADVVLVGKRAIAVAIIESEALCLAQLSQLPNPLHTKFFRGSWYYPFIRMLTMGTLSSDPRALFKNSRFVVFNYDRCLELILLHCLKAYYGLNDQDAAAVLSEIEIVHPYGSLGPLTRQTPFGVPDTDLNEVAKRLLTFTESVDTKTLGHARTLVSEADVLVFLGFGFLPQNMALLNPGDGRRATRVHATTLGFSETDKIVLKERLKQFVRHDLDIGEIQYVGINSTRSGFIDINNAACTDLINNHRMRLT